MRRRALTIAATLLLAGTTAKANGAFPDGLNALFDPTHPHRLSVAATFGLVTTSDGGAHWRYACERMITAEQDVVMYQAGPDGSIYAIASSGLFRTDDAGCHWKRAGGTLAAKGASDAFVDPNDAAHVFAISFDENFRSALFESHDRGDTFGAPVFVTSDVLLSVELAQGGSGRIYLTAWRRGETSSSGWLLAADSVAGPWRETKLADEPAQGTFSRITAVDPTDPNHLFLRMSPAGGGDDDALGESVDGGASVRLVLPLAGPMGGFARAPDGTVYVGSRQGVLHRRDGGATDFTSRAGPAVRCLAIRDGRLLACGDSRLDRFALAESTDRGATWSPVLLLRQLEGPLQCTQEACAADWDALRPTLLLIPPPESADAGAVGVDAGTVEGRDAGDSPDSGTVPNTREADPCGCAAFDALWPMVVPIVIRRVRQRTIVS